MSRLQLVLLLSAAGAALVSHASSENNLIETTRDKYATLQHAVKHHRSGAGGKRTSLKRFVRLTARPPATLALGGGGGRGGGGGAGGELTCEALGSPAPVIRWYKNDVPVIEPGQLWEPAASPRTRSLARVVSTLLIPAPGSRSPGSRSPGPVQVARYTCRASAGRHAVAADTLVYTESGYRSDLSERHRLATLAPRIVSYHSVLMATVGPVGTMRTVGKVGTLGRVGTVGPGGAALRCRATGRPRPTITWTDPAGLAINNTDRMQVLPSGTLVIEPVRWTDMGRYVCSAVNAHGAATADTFLYPAAASKSARR